MAAFDDMDQFVNWDNASGAFPPLHDMAAAGNPPDDDDNIGLHFSQNNFQMPGIEPDAAAVDLTADSSFQFWDTPDNPCAHCLLAGQSCKRIREEGLHKGCCTGCVALRLECSFGRSLVSSSLNNPKPTGLSWSVADNPLGAISQDDLLNASIRIQPTNSASFLDLADLPTGLGDDGGIARPKAGMPAKVGARFSRESVRILKNWLSTHNRHPYPSDEEKKMLQRQTGPNKTQITNWLANARRRGKAHPPRSASPHVGNLSASMDIPQRPGTPLLESMNPLQRWQHSPPENEPASVTAIARAVTASSSAMSSGLNSPYSFNYTDDGSNNGSSLASAYSHGSHNSWGSLGSAPFTTRGRRRRRRRATPNKDGTPSLVFPRKTFQCTFCPETFRTKHDWQRHEKSLHLSLERWVCAPDGPRVVNPENGLLCCVFCGEANPDEAHVETHNHSACQERSLEERTFYRKDHLNQHLRLVHNVKFLDWAMKPWRVATPEIRSKCGFCGIVMNTWSIRVDHLAEHFKTGYSMEDWKGDWGFDMPVLDMVENSIPPYLIHLERNSPFPYLASASPSESPRNAYELIKLELACFGINYWEQHERQPNNEEMMQEGCRIIFASELLSLQGIAAQSSWLRDIIMNDEDITKTAQFGPLRVASENRLQMLKINCKDNLFEECPMERQLQEYVKAKRLLGLTTMDDELQEEARKIVGRVEEVCTHPSEAVANWLLQLITASTNWLAPFRRRAQLPRSEDVQNKAVRSTDPSSIDSTIHNYSRLERELGEYLKKQRSAGVEPTDEALQRQARIIIYEFDDGWNQTVADNIDWLAAFRERNAPNGKSPAAAAAGGSPGSPSKRSRQGTPGKFSISSTRRLSDDLGKCPEEANDNNDWLNKVGNQVMAYFQNNRNCHRRLTKLLSRWVVSTMSAKNPNQHVPTDEELRYQARWLLDDDDDPWNQTIADNAEWLRRFKKDVGIIKETVPGPPLGYACAMGQDAFANDAVEPFNNDAEVAMGVGTEAGQSEANSFLETLGSSPNCTAVFCSRELERGLEEYVKEYFVETGFMPSDAALKAKAREIPRSESTAADDEVLLVKFKEWVQNRLPTKQGMDMLPSAMPTNMDVNISDAELGDILKGMDFDFQQTHDYDMEGIEDDGGVSLGATAPREEQPFLFDD